MYFLGEFCARNNFRAKTIANPVITSLSEYRWPGNVRELRNVIERMAILTPGDLITTQSIPLDMRARQERPPSELRDVRNSAERDRILWALEETNWNVSGAARALGVERTNLHKRIRALGLARDRG